MNKDFDLDLKIEKGPSDEATPYVTSVAYCTPGCLTGDTCGTSECGMTRNCTATWLCY